MVSASTIAIDGPVGAGKSVVGKAAADRLGFRYLDTGVMYRAITWLALDRGVAVDDQGRLARLAADADLRIERPMVNDGRQYTVLVGDRDVTWSLRTPEVEASVSLVSSHPAVREALVAKQRQIARTGGVVMVGRDIGTVVLPGADLKVFLTASPEERARRRWRELVGRGEQVAYESVLAKLRRRDRIDSGRAVAPLRPAEDAVVLDTDGLTVEQVVDRIVELATGV